MKVEQNTREELTGAVRFRSSWLWLVLQVHVRVDEVETMTVNGKAITAPIGFPRFYWRDATKAERQELDLHAFKRAVVYPIGE